MELCFIIICCYCFCHGCCCWRRLLLTFVKCFFYVLAYKNPFKGWLSPVPIALSLPTAAVLIVIVVVVCIAVVYHFLPALAVLYGVVVIAVILYYFFFYLLRLKCLVKWLESLINYAPVIPIFLLLPLLWHVLNMTTEITHILCSQL